MAYKALYRFYRPTNFDDMAGQKYIIQTLKNAVHNHKIAHAYLFCGPRGTGKTSAAKIFAKAVNCLGEKKPCGACENCRSIDAGNFPDIIEIDAASNNGVEEVRSLIDKVKYAPIKGTYKVYIIDEVHMMTQGAYNALLKTIEEPPEHVIFIFATTEPYKVIPTIISRCQRFDFAKISEQDIVSRLNYISKQESITYEDGVLNLIADLADGGMRDALSILDQCFAFSPDAIKKEHIFEIYGMLTGYEKFEVLHNVCLKKTAFSMQRLQELSDRGIDIHRLTLDLIEVLKEIVVYEYTNDIEMIHILNKEQLHTLSSLITTQEALHMIDVLMETMVRYKTATNLTSYLEIAFLNMMSIVSRETMDVPTRKIVDQVIVCKVEEDMIVTQEKLEQIQEESPYLEIGAVQELVEPILQSDETSFVDVQVNPQSNMEEETMQVNSMPKEQDNPAMGEIETTHRKLVEHSIEDEYLLALLASANKDEKQRDQEMQREIHSYKLDIATARYANLFSKCEIIASGEHFVVMSTSSLALSNEINEWKEDDALLSFIELLLKKRKRVFAVTNIQFDRVKDEFIRRNNLKDLPQPIVFESLQIKQEKPKDEQMEKLDILFGNNITIEEN